VFFPRDAPGSCYKRRVSTERKRRPCLWGWGDSMSPNCACAFDNAGTPGSAGRLLLSSPVSRVQCSAACGLLPHASVVAVTTLREIQTLSVSSAFCFQFLGCCRMYLHSEVFLCTPHKFDTPFILFPFVSRNPPSPKKWSPTFCMHGHCLPWRP
jgi:hypothetical protein